MRENGASERALNSAFVRALYDLAFGYENGDIQRPAIAAGQALRGSLRFFFTYRGQLFWKMQAGMGDVVFAPLYEVLRRRGVRFEFFHRLENVSIGEPESPEKHAFVSALEFDVQASPRRGEYEPLVDVRGLPCWPAEPQYEQLRRGAAIKQEGRQFESIWDRRREATRTLRVGADFDFVVFGLGIGAVPYVGQEILNRDVRWRDMVEHVKTVATQALQLWVADDMESLGWSALPVTLSGFVEPFDTWADMRHLLSAESWNEEADPEPPRAIAYFCSALEDKGPAPERPAPGGFLDYIREREDEVRDNAVAFLNCDIRSIWPKANGDDGAFRWDTLVSASRKFGKSGATRIETQWVSANVSPSERYTLTLPGSTKYRISPLDHTYDNLTICGDWTNCGFNEGCVEAAVMSGRLAAHALTGTPALADIIGFDHP